MCSPLGERIAERKAKVCIVGLGYVGLPLAIEAGRLGFTVTGIDTNKDRVNDFNKGIDYILGKNGILKDLVSSGIVRAVSDYSNAGEIDIFVVCVPTALTRNLVPDLQHIQCVAQEISRVLKKGQLVSIESTIFPGTTQEIIKPILEESGLRAETDFYLCHSPERVDPGNPIYNTKNINKLVGGIGPESLRLGMQFYSQILEQVVPVSSVKVAELAKVHENTFRAVNIALVNELALLCDRMDIGVWDVLDAAFTKPFGIMAFYPGPGVGGHCIPVDPHYLEWKAREFNFITKLISISGEINRKMPEFVKEKVIRALNGQGLASSKSKILVMGMAYKKDTGDCRESPVIDVVELLLGDGVDIRYHDPYVQEIEIASIRLQSVELDESAVEWADIVLIATDHTAIDYQWLVKHSQQVVDTRNATRLIPNREKKVILL